MAKVKAFMAVRMPDDIRKHLESTIASLQDAGVTGKWQQRGTLHLTLKYLGKSIDEEILDTIVASLREELTDLDLPKFTVGPLFTFESKNDGMVLAARVRPREDLQRLFRVLERVTVACGGPKHSYPSFRPHVTLCYMSKEGTEAYKQAKVELPDDFGSFDLKSVPIHLSKGKASDFEVRNLVRVSYHIASAMLS